MGTLWFWIVAVMLTGYVVLDGFDLGVGMPGGEGDAQAGGAVRHRRRADGRHQEALVEPLP